MIPELGNLALLLALAFSLAQAVLGTAALLKAVGLLRPDFPLFWGPNQLPIPVDPPQRQVE